MQIPTKKLKNGFEIPVFGLGTWQMGGRKERNLDNDDERDIKAIQEAIDRGITHIDTAEAYANGYSEVLLGKAIKKYDRSKLFITSKVRGTNLAFDSIINSCKESLKRLETEYLNLYLLHAYNSDFPLKDSIRALDQLVAEGLVRNIGVSNFTPEHVAEAQTYSSNKIVCNQVHYNLVCREPERKQLTEYCQKNDVFLVAYRPVGKGELLENISPVMEEMCKKYNKTPAQIAINWLISQPYVVALSKTSTIEHLDENLGAVGWQMDGADVELLRREYPGQMDLSDTVTLK